VHIEKCLRSTTASSLLFSVQREVNNNPTLLSTHLDPSSLILPPRSVPHTLDIYLEPEAVKAARSTMPPTRRQLALQEAREQRARAQSYAPSDSSSESSRSSRSSKASLSQQRRRAREAAGDQFLGALTVDQLEGVVERDDLGLQDQVCAHCKATFFLSERTSNSTRRSPRYKRCCGEGGIEEPLLGEVKGERLQAWLLDVQGGSGGFEFRTCWVAGLHHL
jgi:hypothetical protein